MDEARTESTGLINWSVVPNVNIYTCFIATEDTESTEGLCPYFLYSVFSGLSVVKLSLEIGEGIRGIDYN
jgi:hypothetical protein